MDTVLKLGHQLYIIFFLNIVDSEGSTIVKISLSLRLSCLNVLIGDTYTYSGRGIITRYSKIWFVSWCSPVICITHYPWIRMTSLQS